MEYIVLILAVLIGICIFIYRIVRKEMHIFSSGLKHEIIAREIYKSLLRKNEKLSVEEAKIVISSIIDEGWFVSLNREQIRNVTCQINEYINQNCCGISELEIKTLVKNFKENPVG